MDLFVSPILLYSACTLGALGVALALPRRGISPQVIGFIIAGAALGGLFLLLSVSSPGGSLPNPNFYIFSAVALGAALRVISHPRPVYAALYFVLTILSSCGLYVLLSAEFMAFALVIVYAGAILITYLFVIMLATEPPTGEQTEALADYDRYSREPAFAAALGFVLVAVLSTMFVRGVGPLAPDRTGPDPDAALLPLMPQKIESALRAAKVIEADEAVARDASGRPLIDLAAGTITVVYGQGVRQIHRDKWPDSLKVMNVEALGFSLLAEHPGSIEIAGVVLLMAMLGAVVLARKKVELDEQAKLAAAHRHLTDQPQPGAAGGGA